MSLKQKFGITASTLAITATAILGGCGTQSTNSASQSGNQAGSTGTAQPSSKKTTVTLGYIDWPENVATAQLWKYLLEKKGYTVKFQTLSPGPMYLAVSKGSVDVFSDVWLPHADAKYMKQYGKNYVELGKWFKPTREGLVVPSYVNINSISQLNSHAKEFKNRIVGIEPGAGETTLIKNTVIPKYGIKLNLVNSSTTAMISTLQKAIKAHKPVAVVLWSPYWVFAKWHLKFLKDPKDTFGDNSKPGWIESIANKNWAQKHPKVAAWFKNYKMTPKMLDTLELDIKKAPANQPQIGVKKWVQANQSTVNSWFQ